MAVADLGGYIKFFRRFQNHPIWKDKEPFDKRSAWMDICFEARWGSEPNVTIIDGHIITVLRGEVAYSYQTWANRWRWNKSKVRRWFKQLEKLGQIITVDERKTTRLIVCNYDIYQDFGHAGEPQSDYEPTFTRHSPDIHPTPTEGKGKKEKEGEGGKPPPPSSDLLRHLENFQKVHPECKSIGEIAFTAAIAACRTETAEPDVAEALDAFSRHWSCVASFGRQSPIREFEKYLRNSAKKIGKQKKDAPVRSNMVKRVRQNNIEVD